MESRIKTKPTAPPFIFLNVKHKKLIEIPPYYIYTLAGAEPTSRHNVTENITAVLSSRALQFK
jgi:hypothetical protein